jgi:hypothetical protein
MASIFTNDRGHKLKAIVTQEGAGTVTVDADEYTMIQNCFTTASSGSISVGGYPIVSSNILGGVALWGQLGGDVLVLGTTSRVIVYIYDGTGIASS